MELCLPHSAVCKVRRDECLMRHGRMNLLLWLKWMGECAWCVGGVMDTCMDGWLDEWMGG